MGRLILILGAAIMALAIGLGLWLWLGSTAQKTGNNLANHGATDERVDMTSSQSVAVTIKDLSFGPPNIKIKTGTRVTWTNQNSMGHSIEADDPANTGGLPTDLPLFGRSETFSHTFKQVGLFRYHCGAHSFMHGSVEVVE